MHPAPQGACVSTGGRKAPFSLVELATAARRRPMHALAPAQSDPDDPWRRRIGIQRLHRRRAAQEHRPLVDVALVGDLPGICIGRAVHHHGPCGALRRSRTGIAARAHHGLQRLLQPRSIGRTSRRREHHHAHLVAVMPGEHDVLHQWRQLRFHPGGAAGPGSGCASPLRCRSSRPAPGHQASLWHSPPAIPHAARTGLQRDGTAQRERTIVKLWAHSALGNLPTAR